jgi:hypothetical protein
MPQPGIAKAVSLALLVSAMSKAAEQYEADRIRAIETLETALERFTNQGRFGHWR